MGYVIGFLMILGLAGIIGAAIFKNTRTDRGLTKYRGYVFLAAVFLAILATWRGDEQLGYVSLFLFFLVVCMLYARHMSKTKQATDFEDTFGK